MFICEKCKTDKLKIICKDNKYYEVCDNCKYEEVIIPTKRKCFNCNGDYDEITPFIPSSCPHCNRTYLD